jgi:hypothetical protein
MAFELKPIETLKQEHIDPIIGKFSNNEKFDVLFVIMIVLLLFAFSKITSFIFRGIGVVIIALGIYTLII